MEGSLYCFCLRNAESVHVICIRLRCCASCFFSFPYYLPLFFCYHDHLELELGSAEQFPKKRKQRGIYNLTPGGLKTERGKVQDFAFQNTRKGSWR